MTLPRPIRHLLRRRGPDREGSTDAYLAIVHGAQPKLALAIAADARITAAARGEREVFRSRLDVVVQVLRLALVTEAFLAQCCYRLKASCRAAGIPLLPHLLHHLAVIQGQVTIGDPVVLEAGVHLAHGQVCIDGMTIVGSGTVIGPFVTIGLVSGEFAGPSIGPDVTIGSGARILGPCRIGAGAVIGANAVVTKDVPAGCRVEGVPARAMD